MTRVTRAAGDPVKAGGFLFVALVIASAGGCSRPPPDSTPDGAVRVFLDDMDSAGDDPAVVRRAYQRLGPVARANLVERARRTSELQGRHFEPWDMVAAGLFGVAFRPKAMHATVVGDRASVDVFGEDPHTEHAAVACVREGQSWRIEPGFPEP
jgi:hypothetical protein